MKKLFRKTFLAVTCCFASSAWGSYPYQNTCPVGQQVFPGDVLIDPNPKIPYDEYWASIYRFAQCNCTDYVAYKLNSILERHSPTHPMFHNSFHNIGSFVWSHAYHWRDAIGVAVPGFVSRYPVTLSMNDSGYPWKVTKEGVAYDVRMAIAWWDKDPSNPQSVGHVAWLESVAADKKTVTVSEYNWPSASNGNQILRFGTRTLTPGQSGYPDGFLYIVTDSFFECDLMGLCDGSFSGKPGGGGGFHQVNLENSFRVTQRDGSSIYPGDTVLTPGQTVLLKVQIKAMDDDAERWAQPGKEKIETDYFVRIGDGDWAYKNREYTRITNLRQDATHTETFAFVIPYTAGQPISFKVKIDAENEVNESNEHDNTSRIDAFQVANAPMSQPDLITHSFRFLQTPIYAGDQARLAGIIQNIGPVPPPFGIRSSYSVECPGTGSIFLTDDGTHSDELIPGREIPEETKNPVTLPNVSGACRAFFCVDSQNWVSESDETNNCSSFSFNLIERPNPPDLIVSAFGLREGTSIKKGSRVHPWCQVTNIGGDSPRAIQIAYYINTDQFRDNDTVEASELCAGCSKTEEVQNDHIKLGDKGTRTYRCCVDYQDVVAESNEGNNCATMSFVVR